MSPSKGTAPDVSIVVVNFQGEASVAACLESLVTDPDAPEEIIVVDNASTDASPRIIADFAARHAAISAITSDLNRGYAAGVDLALASCRGRYLAVLNMDVVVEPGWLPPLVEHLDRNPEVGAVVPLLMLSDGRGVNAAGQWVHVTGLGFNRDLGRPAAAVGDRPFPIAGIQGAAFVVRRDLVDEIGGLDTGGFLYHEDVNLSWLLRMMGHELACVPRSVVHHDYFLSMHPEKLELLERNRAAMLAAYLDPSSRRRIAPWLWLTEAMLWGYALIRGPAFLRAKARARRWVREQARQIDERRRLAGRLRVRSDREVLRAMSRRYPIRQLFALARERGRPRRPLAG